MGNPISLDQAINTTEKNLSLYKFVLEKVPDAKVHNGPYYNGFSAKSVNSSYTNFEFVKSGRALYVIPYLELDFPYENSIHKIRVNSSPRASRLAYISFSREFRKSIIKFSRLKFNLKNNKFKEEMLNSCMVEIINYVKQFSNLSIDDKNLDPKLKKLLLFI